MSRKPTAEGSAQIRRREQYHAKKNAPIVLFDDGRPGQNDAAVFGTVDEALQAIIEA